jgi:hypothetical protein
MLLTSLTAAALLASLPVSPDPAMHAPVEVITRAPSESSVPRFSYGRAGLELGAVMGLGVTWYETQIELNKKDFDFQRSWSSQWERIATGRGFRFDDNEPVLNVGHAFVGMYEHQLARTNNGTLLQSFLFDLTASSVWELAVEHREVFSLNDTVVTSVGGMALGEPIYQMGAFFARSGGWRNRLLATLFSPPTGVTALLEGGRGTRPMLDAHGFADDGYHRFALSAGGTAPAFGGAPDAAPAMAARLDMELFNLRSYGREGQVSRALRGGEASRVQVDYAGTRDDLQALTIATRTSLFGRYAQNVTGEGTARSGRSVLVAAGSAFDLSLDDHGRFTDFLTAVHAIGPTADASLYRGPFALRVAADVYGDFAMVRPFALDPDAPAELLAGTKSVLQNQHYYYALGVTAAARAEASYRRLRAGAAVEWNGYDSIEGLDRRQDDFTSPTGVFHPGITDDFDITDQRLKLRLYSDIPTFANDLYVRLSLDVQHRSGEMKDVVRAEDEGRAAVMLSYVM